MMWPYAPVIALFFFALVVWRRGWHRTGVILLLAGVVCAVAAQAWLQELVQSYVKGGLAQERTSFYTRLESLETAVSGLTQQVSAQQGALEAQAEQVAAQQSAITGQQEASAELQRVLTKTQGRLETQATQLGTMGSLAQDLSTGEQSESFKEGETSRLILLPLEPEGAVAYLQLWHIPRLESVKLQWRSTTFAPEQYRVHKNIVVVKAEESSRKLRRHPFSVTYLPDSSRVEDTAALWQAEDGVYAGDESLASVMSGFLD